MRCLKCNVDLGEEYTRCPLCGEKASNTPPVLSGFKTAEYPQYDEKTAFEKAKFKRSFPMKYLLRAAVLLCVLFGVLALFGLKPLWNIGVPVIFAATSAAYFVFSLFEKGRLLHSGVALLATFFASLPFLLAALIAKSGVSAMAVCVLLCLVFFLLAWAIKPARMKEQMKAIFVL